MPQHNPDFPTPQPVGRTLPNLLLDLCFLASKTSRAGHGRLVEKFMDVNPEVGIINPAFNRESQIDLLIEWDHSEDPDELEGDIVKAGELVDRYFAEHGGAP